MKRAVAATVALILVGLVAGYSDASTKRPIGDTRVFTRVPEPGAPEGLVVRDGIVYVGTHVSIQGNSGEGPSKIFMYDLDSRKPRGQITIKGQNLDETHGILGMAFDGDDRLYVLDRNPARVLRLDLSGGRPEQETYATVPDLKPCRSNPEPCSPTTLDQPAFPDYLAFDAKGKLYVTDLEQSAIFRVAPGGGEAKVWFADERLDSIFGPNGIAVDRAGDKLFFAMTGSFQPTSPTQGFIYTLPITDQPKAEDLQDFFAYVEPSVGPDGIAFGKSGKLYVALAGSNQISVLTPKGEEAHRFPTFVENQQQEVPYDLPASVAFDGKGSLLVTNQSFFANNSNHWVVFDAFVDDVALPLVEPEKIP